MEFDDFQRFVKDETELDAELLKAKTISKGTLRHMIALYISDKLRYTSQSKIKQDERTDFSHHYYGHKAAKDLLMLINSDTLTTKEVKSLFETRAVLNYVNDLVLNIIEYYVEMRDGFGRTYDPMTRKGSFDFAYMREMIN